MSEIFDKDLGRIVIIENSRARRLIARRKVDFVQVTIPTSYPIEKVKDFIEEVKPRLLEIKPKEALHFNENVKFQTLTFSTEISRSSLQNYYSRIKDGVLYISCPVNVDFNKQETQTVLRRIIENSLRMEAKAYLSERLRLLAQKHGFKYSALKINKSRTRWGSCSSSGNINLSIYCMLLPSHLADFVILHELCHTVEMNHGTNFWRLLDRVTANRAKALTKELKAIKIDW
ncbi:DUF45 domain-containing protein [Dysgonomonas sp. 216]|uniref:M48 family metallopeptidase n=1 Tax=Dysgonomonas sp. 216 TaxID=2302934 RepID=UPI0013D50C95|nr:YgjP-like metallopeptidase domain-containing protein [Dysgonomonas sp. 216]NDW18551.1 DUF45 domain-containing protein [Dysgonomonas sp. 216]